MNITMIFYEHGWSKYVYVWIKDIEQNNYVLTYFLSRASKHPFTHWMTWQAPGQALSSLRIFRFRSAHEE